MKTLVIYAHPATQGHCPFIFEQVKKTLEEKKIEYEAIDLYSIKYDPVLHEDEHYTAGKRNVSKENKEMQKKILDSELLIFIYPIWWGSAPAILKGFLDKVLVSGFAFRYVNGIPIGLLKGKRALVFMTSGGPTWYYKLTGNVPARIMKSMTLGFCGIKTKVYQIGRCLSFDDDKKKEITKTVRKAFEKI